MRQTSVRRGARSAAHDPGGSAGRRGRRPTRWLWRRHFAELGAHPRLRHAGDGRSRSSTRSSAAGPGTSSSRRSCSARSRARSRPWRASWRGAAETPAPPDLHDQGAGPAGRVRRRGLAGRIARAHRAHDPRPGARVDPGAGARRQRDLLAGRLLADALSSRSCSATPTRSTTPPAATAAAATRRCATTTSSSRTAPSPCPATSPTGSSSTCPSRGTAPTATRGTSPTISPAPCGASPETPWPSSPRRTPDFPWADYDNENPYGITGDDFNQPDGYVDHLILIHAGSDQAAGGGAQDSDAIWSHSWGILENTSGGPGDGPGYMVPGTRGPGAPADRHLGLPVHDQPRGRRTGVFCHEFGHDLGLPDEYDYSSTTGDASSGFWTVMSSGSNLGRQWGLGSEPGPMNVWDKYALGFVTPKVVKRGTTATVKLQPAATGAAALDGRHHPAAEAQARDPAQRQGRRSGVVLRHGRRPRQPAHHEVRRHRAGRRPGGADAAHLVRHRGGLRLRLRARLRGRRHHVGDASRARATPSRSSRASTALTGTDTEHWADTISYDLSAYAGKSVLLQFRYSTDGGVALKGWEVTDIKVGGTHASRQPTSRATAGCASTARRPTMSDNYYIAEYRTHDGSDALLKNCYQVERPLRPTGSTGSATTRVCTSSTATRSGTTTTWPRTSARAAGWSSTRGRSPTGSPTTRPSATGGRASRCATRPSASSGRRPRASGSRTTTPAWAWARASLPARRRKPWFNDTWTYWFPETPEAGVKIPQNLGVRIQVKSMNADGMTIWVDNKK